jgi:hypothetical protein
MVRRKSKIERLESRDLLSATPSFTLSSELWTPTSPTDEQLVARVGYTLAALSAEWLTFTQIESLETFVAYSRTARQSPNFPILADHVLADIWAVESLFGIQDDLS